MRIYGPHTIKTELVNKPNESFDELLSQDLESMNKKTDAFVTKFKKIDMKFE
jgi:hypothetical protein